jgi:SAM-dependent methyltransferase
VRGARTGRLSLLARSAGLVLTAPDASRLDGSVRRKYEDPVEVAAHRQQALDGLTPSQQQFIDRYLAPARRVLDVGCAAGRVAHAVHRRGHRAVAIDVSAPMVSEAAAVAGDGGPAFCVMDGRQLALGPASFDAVLMLGSVLSYVPRREGRMAALREAHRVLRPGGLLLLETQSRTASVTYRVFFALLGVLSLAARAVGRDRWEIGDRYGVNVSGAHSADPVYFHMYAPGELERDLARAGFQPERHDAALYLMYYAGRKAA